MRSAGRPGWRWPPRSWPACSRTRSARSRSATRPPCSARRPGASGDSAGWSSATPCSRAACSVPSRRPWRRWASICLWRAEAWSNGRGRGRRCMPSEPACLALVTTPALGAVLDFLDRSVGNVEVKEKLDEVEPTRRTVRPRGSASCSRPCWSSWRSWWPFYGTSRCGIRPPTGGNWTPRASAWSASRRPGAASWTERRHAGGQPAQLLHRHLRGGAAAAGTADQHRQQRRRARGPAVPGPPARTRDHAQGDRQPHRAAAGSSADRLAGRERGCAGPMGGAQREARRGGRVGRIGQDLHEPGASRAGLRRSRPAPEPNPDEPYRIFYMPEMAGRSGIEKAANQRLAARPAAG